MWLNRKCQRSLRKTRLGRYFRLDDTFVCAGGEEGKDSCVGDGGGPLACQNPTTGQYELAGMTSWGIDCGKKDIPGVYAKVSVVSEWITNILDMHYGVYDFTTESTDEEEGDAYNVNESQEPSVDPYGGLTPGNYGYGRK